jgi:hypothetical protein
MATAIITSFDQQCDSNGDPISGAKVYVYNVGTTTLRSIYSNTGLTTAAANPIVCDSAGRHDMRYTATGSYKIVVKTSTDVTVYTRDNIDGSIPVGGSGILAIANGGTGASTAPTALANLGGVTSAEFSDLSAEVAALSGALGSSEKTHIATGTTAQRPVTPVQGDGRWNTSLGGFGELEFYDGTNWRQFSAAQPIAGGFINLVVTNNSGTPTTSVDVDADAVTVETTGGEAYRIRSVNLTIACAGTGANGLDAGSLSTSTWYSIWVIYNPTTSTTAGLAGTSATAPTMPSGYTAKARVGWMRTNGSSQFHRITQRGRRAQWIVGTDPAVARNIANGVAGTYSTTSPVLAAVSITTHVPTTASSIQIMATTSYGGGTNGSVLVAPTTAWGGTNNGPAGSAFNCFPLSLASGNIGGSANFTTWMQLETTTIAWAGANTGSGIYVMGWEDNL